jgi:hypothetical protein
MRWMVSLILVLNYCFDGHLCVPYEQNTQQSSPLGYITVKQFEHVKDNKHTSVGKISMREYPHFGQVMRDSNGLISGNEAESAAEVQQALEECSVQPCVRIQSVKRTKAVVYFIVSWIECDLNLQE